MSREKVALEFAVLAALSAGLGYTLASLSSVGVPEGAIAGEPLEKAGGGMFIAVALTAFICAWLRPRMFFVWPFGLALGFVSLVAYRVTIHAPGQSSYPIAFALSVAPLAGAVVGSVFGALGSQMFATQKVREKEPVIVMVIGRWIVICGFLFVLVPIPMIAAVLTPLLILLGSILYVIGRMRREESQPRQDPTSPPPST
jgi:hypothetical protein